jgi:hypothetical protein
VGRGRFVAGGREEPMRLSGVATRDGDRWVFVQSHASIGVPNDDLFDLPSVLKFVVVVFACLLVIIVVAFTIGGIVGEVIILVAGLALFVQGVGSLVRAVHRPSDRT